MSKLNNISPSGSTNMIEGLKTAISVLKNVDNLIEKESMNISENNNNSNSRSCFSKRVVLLSGLFTHYLFH
jgi:hypothetical protein